MLKLLRDEHISLDGWLSPRKWISSLAWRGDAIPSRLKVSATCTLIVTPQRACLLQAHLVLETDPSFRLILYWKRLSMEHRPGAGYTSATLGQSQSKGGISHD